MRVQVNIVGMVKNISPIVSRWLSFAACQRVLGDLQQPCVALLLQFYSFSTTVRN